MSLHSVTAKSIAAVFLGIFIVLVAADSVGSPPIEGQGTSVKKVYSSGNWISLSCAPRQIQKCVIETKIGSRKRRINLNLEAYGLKAEFEKIRLYVLSDSGDDYSFKISVDCEDEDFRLIQGPNLPAECLASFTVMEGEFNGSPHMQVFPITTQDLHRVIGPIKKP